MDMKYNLTRDQLIEKKFELTGRYRIAFNGVTFSLYHVYKNKKELHPKFVQSQKGRRKFYVAYNLDGNSTISAARLYYIWFHGSIPEGCNICYKDKNTLNNMKYYLVAKSHRDICMENYTDKEITCKYAEYCGLRQEILNMSDSQYNKYVENQKKLL